MYEFMKKKLENHYTLKSKGKIYQVKLRLVKSG